LRGLVRRDKCHPRRYYMPHWAWNTSKQDAIWRFFSKPPSFNRADHCYSKYNYILSHPEFHFKINE